MTEEPDKPANEDPQKTSGEASQKSGSEASQKAAGEESQKTAGEDANKTTEEEPPKTTSEAAKKPASRRLVWVRGFYMLLMLLVWQFAEAVLVAVTIVQFIFNLVGEPNERLTVFGDSLARYLQQVARFLTYASDDLPFPFADWPAKV